MAVKSGYAPPICKVARLVAAIIGMPTREIFTKLGIPPEEPKLCLNCSEPLVKQNRFFCSRECQMQYVRISLICEECGKVFYRRALKVAHDLGEKNYQHIWCSYRCHGLWLAKHYGFAVYPEHAHKRKHDWERIWQLHLDTGWGAPRLSKKLGIPVSTISSILWKKRSTE